MADPLTAIGSAAAILQLTEEAAKLGIYLCKLYKDTKHVDKTVDQLGVEVVTLGETWTVVHVQLHAVIQTTAGTKRASIGVYDSTGQLWKCICDQVQHCWRTLKDLQGIIDAIGGTHGNIVTQIKRQIKVEGSKEAISSVRQRVGLHMSSIQMILQLISIEVAHLAPRHANHELLAKLNTLGKMVQDLNGQNTTVSGETAAVQIDGAASLIACVKEVMHSGASLYNASVADGSTYGGSHRAERQQWTTAWLQDLDALKTPDFAAASVNGSATPSNFSSGRIDLLQSGEVSLISDPLYNTEVQDIMDDDDHYIEHAMLTLGLEEGRRAVHCEQWAVADQHLKESLSLLLQLPENSRSTYDIIELQYMLAFCAFHFKEEDLKITREALTSLVDRMPGTDKQRSMICDARYLLARLCIRDGDLEGARRSCQSASDGRRRLLGDKNDTYYEALALLTRIYTLQDNTRRARLVELMIPESQRSAALTNADSILAADADISSKESALRARRSSTLNAARHTEPQGVGFSTRRAHERSRLSNGAVKGSLGASAEPDSSAHTALTARGTRSTNDTSHNARDSNHSPTSEDVLSISRNSGRDARAEKRRARSPAEARYQNVSGATSSTGSHRLDMASGPVSEPTTTEASRPEDLVGRESPIERQQTSDRLTESLVPRPPAIPRLVLCWTAKMKITAHTERVDSLAFSPDSRLLASASFDNVCQLWNTMTGKIVHTFSYQELNHPDFLKVAFSPDGLLLASIMSDSTVRLWDTGSKRVVRQLGTTDHNPHSTYTVAFSPNGRHLVSGHADKAVRLWDVATGGIITAMEGHEGPVRTVAFSPCGRFIASGSDDTTVRIWDASLLTCVTGFKGHVYAVCSVAFSPDSRFLASGSDDTRIKIWTTSTWTEVKTLKGHSGSVRTVAFSPEGATLASASSDATVRLWDVNTWTQTLTYIEGRSSCSDVAFSSDGRMLAWSTSTGVVTLRDREKARPVRKTGLHKLFF